jgi:membrane protein DedA with SNARE-associated domain
MTILNVNIVFPNVKQSDVWTTIFGIFLGAYKMDNPLIFLAQVIIGLLVWGAVCLAINWQHSRLESKRLKTEFAYSLAIICITVIGSALVSRIYRRIA